MKKKILIALGLVLIVAVVIGAVIKSNKTSAVDVKTAEAKTMEYEDKILAAGRVEVVDSADLAAAVLTPAKLTLKVQEGDQVKKGQVVAELDLSEQQQQLKDAESALKTVKAELANTRQSISAAEKELTEYTRKMEQLKEVPEEQKNMYENAQSGVPDPTQRMNSLQMQESTLKGQVKQYQAAVDTARSSVEKGKIKATSDGVVLQVSAKSGSYVQAGVPLMTVGAPEKLQVVAKLSEQDVNGVVAGQEVEVRWAGAPGEVVKGSVSRIAPTVSQPGMGETESHVKVYITIDDGAVLKPGATVDVVIYRIKPRQSLQVANETLVGEGDQKSIFIVKDGAAKKCSVETGENNELYTEIKQGIKPGSKVILDPAKIKDGQKVRITGGGTK